VKEITDKGDYFLCKELFINYVEKIVRDKRGGIALLVECPLTESKVRGSKHCHANIYYFVMAKNGLSTSVSKF
jgi:hypothetical protein